VSRRDVRRGALEAVERILNRGGDADDVLRAAVAVLYERLGCSWVAIAFVEGDELVIGPSQGRAAAESTAVPVVYEGRRIAELRLAPASPDDDEERVFLERVAVLVSAHCLVGWDTEGVPWPDVS
jgi:putative methionine-R-sulfoxide reductase with GAF domain